MKKLILPLVVLLIAVLGCAKIKELASGGKGNPDSGSSGSGSSTAGADPKADIIAASKKFIALAAFSAKMDGMGQTPIKSQVDYVAPDRYHISYLGGTGAGIEMIMIGNDMYTKLGSKWNKSPGNASAIPTLRDSFTEEGLKTLSDTKFEGNDTVDGKPALVYSYKNVTPKGSFGFSCKMWVAEKTGLPMKIYATYDNGMLKEMTVNYDTESKVTIDPPTQ